MEKKMCLSGRWELSWLEIGQGRLELADLLFAGEKCILCPVPGDVHMALTDAGIIQDPLLDRNSFQCKWLETQEFWYRKKFTLAEDFLQDKTQLTFEGLDTTAAIWLNGKFIGSHNNAFIEKTVDISDCVKPGENVLIVRIDDGVNAVKDKPLELMKHSWNGEQPYRAWMRKPQFVYGWDWTIWLPTCGIWKDVTIQSYSKAAIGNVNVRNRFVGEEVTLETTVELEFLQPGAYTLKCQVSGDKRFGSDAVVAEAHKSIGIDKAGEGAFALEVTLDQPRLWWPNGAGDPYLYTVEVSIEDEAGNTVQRIRRRHGIRTVCIREDVLDEKSKSFTFTVNGQRIFCKGANHVPADCFPGRITEEKARALLKAAADGNMNMIRVWGGGVYESECFMDTCDELGLMVWHDFMFACAYYPDHDPEFFEEIRREATAAIRRLRGHASLVGWSGNNEIQEMYTAVRQWNPDHPWYGGRIYEELLPSLVEELCPDRIYRQSSPFGGDEPTSYDQGDQHTWHFTHRPGWEHYLDLWRFTDFDFKFLSEFGIIGAMNLDSAGKCIREEALDPNSPEWLHHTNTSSNHQLLNTFVDVYFGLNSVRDLQDYILKSQAVQAEIMRHIYDELRSRKFRCSGVLLWTLSDSYGIHNWSVIDYYLGRRPVYYYLKRSMAEVNVSFMGYEVQSFDGMAGYRAHWQGKPAPIEILVTSDAFTEKKLRLTYEVMTFGGAVRKRGTVEDTVGANTVKKFAEVDVSDVADFTPEETVLYARVWEGDRLLSENHYFFAPYGKLNLKKAKVTCSVEKTAEDKAQLTLTCDTFVWMLHMDDPVGSICSDNDFLLLPGVPRTITLSGEISVPVMHSLNPGLEIC